jgi:hypothetical protein
MATAAQRKAERIAAEEEARMVKQRASAPMAGQQTQTMNRAAEYGEDQVTFAPQVEENVFVPGYTTGMTSQPPTTVVESPVKVTKKPIGIYTDPATGDVIERYDDGTEAVVRKGTIQRDSTLAANNAAATKQAERQSAYDLLFEQFSKYGLGSLVEPLKGLITSGASPAEFTIKLRETPAYQKRFAANADRIKKGLTPLVEGDYLALEDQYQNVMRNYGLPETYWTRGDLGTQEGFTKLLANDVSASELENRIITAQDRVLKSNPQVLETLKQFYPGITNGDILAYTLDPANALKDIQRKVTAAEIGGAASAAGLSLGKTPEEIAASEARAQMLAGYGVTKEAATTGFQTVAEIAPRGSQLAEFYNRPTYNQMQAEQEVFNLEGAVASRKRRKELIGLEEAQFSAKSGAAQGALGRERAGNL